MATTTSKRARTEPPSVEDVMYYARFFMEKDPFKHKAPKVEDDAFRAMFGCGPAIVLKLWNLLVEHSLMPRMGQMKHLLWTLMYCKTYAKWKTMQKLTETDPKTLRKWIDLFYESIFELAPKVIIWKNRKKGDILNDCLVSVDGTDFLVPFHGRKFHSHKFKFGSGLRYEVAVSILGGDLVWINGPYEAGLWPDIKIIRNALISELEPGERVEADDGYRGEAPQYVKCPRSMGSDEITEAMAAIVRRRQETVNK
eukprot:scaffold3950_cov138-Amphora_coffeaeformis.AAC.1